MQSSVLNSPALSPSARSWALDGFADFMPSRHAGLLQRDPEKYSEMVRGVTAFGIYLIDRDGRIRSWNQGAANITGLSEAEVVGQNFASLFVEDAARDGAPQKMLEFVRANGHCRDEQRRRRRNGSDFVAQCSLDALRSESGELLGFIEVFQDVTERRQREDRVHHRATRDALSGAYTHGHFTEMAMLELDRARRFAEPLSLLIVDIDHLRKINDGHGHDAGDKAIVALARTIAEHLRKIDFCGRVGGEEFAVVMPRANKEPALESALRLRRRIAEQRVVVSPGKEIGFTASVGLASLRPTTRDLAELMRNADAALYKAKREGRNRVEAWFE